MIRRCPLALAVTVSLFAQDVAMAQTCGFRPAFSRSDERGTRRIRVYEGAPDPRIANTRPLLFVSVLKVNTDGTRISYNAADPRASRIAINDLRNAMRPGRTIAEVTALAAAGWPLPQTWTVLAPWVIERDRRTGKPCADHAGYLVSKTSEVAVDGGSARDGDCDQSKWLDALDVPALVLPLGRTEFSARGADNRTPVVAMTLGAHARIAYGLVGDKGPVKELGEASVAMNRTLNGLPHTAVPANYSDAVARFQGPRSAILLFPGTSQRIARPLTGASVTAATKNIFDRWGGQDRLNACLAEVPEAR